jgi:hypothetical protein
VCERKKKVQKIPVSGTKEKKSFGEEKIEKKSKENPNFAGEKIRDKWFQTQLCCWRIKAYDLWAAVRDCWKWSQRPIKKFSLSTTSTICTKSKAIRLPGKLNLTKLERVKFPHHQDPLEFARFIVSCNLRISTKI